MKNYIFDDWINHLTESRPEIGGLPICPFAKSADYEIIKTDGSDIDPPPWNFELIIYVFPEEYTEKELTEIAKEYNKIRPELVFLPDHKDRKTYINGVQTSNGRYNVLFCQYRDNLERARNKLKNTLYYSFWDAQYLKEILES